MLRKAILALAPILAIAIGATTVAATPADARPNRPWYQRLPQPTLKVGSPAANAIRHLCHGHRHHIVTGRC